MEIFLTAYFNVSFKICNFARECDGNAVVFA